MLEGWEQKMGVDLVQDSLSLLCLARQVASHIESWLYFLTSMFKGLSQQELEDLLQVSEPFRLALHQA